MSTVERREASGDTRLGGAHQPGRWRRLSMQCSLPGHMSSNTRSCRNLLSEDNKDGFCAPSKHVEILGPTSVNSGTPEPSKCQDDHPPGNWFLRLAHVKINLYLLMRSWSPHTFCQLSGLHSTCGSIGTLKLIPEPLTVLR